MARAILLAAFCLLASCLSAQFGPENQLVDGVPPSTGNVQQGATQHNSLHFLLARFDMNSDTFAGLTIRNNGTAQASDIAQIQLWWDANDSDTFEPAGPDVVVGSAPSGAFPISLSSMTPQNHLGLSGYGYYVTVDVSAGAVVGRTFILEVTPGDVGMLSYPVVYFSGAFVGPTQTVSAGTPNQIVMTNQPNGAQAGTAFTSQPVMELRTAGGALLSGDSSTVVTAAITGGTGTGGAVLGGTLTAQASGGVVSFTNLSIDLAGSTYTLTFTATGFTPATSAQFNVGATQTPTQLVITTQPAGAAPGAAFTTQPVVEIRDSGGALVSGASNNVMATLNGGPGTLTGTVTVQASGGVATFTNLAVTQAGTGYSLTFTATGLTGATSNSFDVTAPQTPTQLAITVQPGGATAGSAFATQPVIQIRDGNGVLVTSATHSVAVTLNGGSGGTLSGTLIVAAVNGVATFTDLEINQAGIGYSLTFSAVGLTSDTSNSFDITGGGGTGGGGGGGGSGGGCAATQSEQSPIWVLSLAALAPLMLLKRRKT